MKYPENVVIELQAILDVRKELEKAQTKKEGYEILGRLIVLYSALNVEDIKTELERKAG